MADSNSKLSDERSQIESLAILPGEAPVAVALCLLSWVLYNSWTLVSALAATGSFLILAGGLIYRLRQRRLLKDPCTVHFVILKENEFKMDYHTQDSEYHYPDELSLPSNSERVVVIWMKPRLDLTMNELQFGCIGETGSKPEPLYYVLPWVKTGVIKEKHPDKDEDHYVDVTDIYHIVQRDKLWVKDEEKMAGLMIRTKAKGKYDFWMRFLMPGVRADKTLKINVI